MCVCHLLREALLGVNDEFENIVVLQIVFLLMNI